MHTPELTIITVCYNSVSTIEATINSVLSQSFQNYEYIIIDGLSTDGTQDIIKRYIDNKKVKFIIEADNGVYDAMNKGVKLAVGEWVYFLGSDDILYDNEVIERIIGNENYDSQQIIYGNVKFLHQGIIYDGPFNHEKISTKNICHQALFVRKAVFDKTGLFDEKYKISADYAFNIKWLGLNLPSKYVEETIALYNEKGMSGKIWDQVFYNDFDNLLIENNIISPRSFAALKRTQQQLLNSYKYKAGKLFLDPILYLKKKLNPRRNGGN